MSRKRKVEDEEDDDDDDDDDEGEPTTTADVIQDPKWLLRIPNELGEQVCLAFATFGVVWIEPGNSQAHFDFFMELDSGGNRKQHGGTIMRQSERPIFIPKIKNCRFCPNSSDALASLNRVLLIFNQYEVTWRMFWFSIIWAERRGTEKELCGAGLDLGKHHYRFPTVRFRPPFCRYNPLSKLLNEARPFTLEQTRDI
jgi:hypothetical protein